MVDAHPFVSNAVGGVKLRVPGEEREEALALLRSVEGGEAEPFPMGWMALTALYLGPLAAVLLPAAWIWNRTAAER